MTQSEIQPEQETPDSLVFGDAHTHLNQYAPGEIPGIVERAEAANVRFIVCAGTTVESTRACIEMARQYDIFYAGVGIHPMEAHRTLDDAAYAELESLARERPEVVCISEVGLDYLPESPDHETQDQVFRNTSGWPGASACLSSSTRGSRTRRSSGCCGRNTPAR